MIVRRNCKPSLQNTPSNSSVGLVTTVQAYQSHQVAWPMGVTVADDSKSISCTLAFGTSFGVIQHVGFSHTSSRVELPRFSTTLSRQETRAYDLVWRQLPAVQNVINKHSRWLILSTSVQSLQTLCTMTASETSNASFGPTISAASVYNDISEMKLEAAEVVLGLEFHLRTLNTAMAVDKILLVQEPNITKNTQAGACNTVLFERICIKVAVDLC